MKLSEKKIKKIIKNYNIQHRDDALNFIDDNPESLDIFELSRIAELVNNERTDTAAYYTDNSILETIGKFLPDINKKIIRVLEPAVGVGNFLQLIIDKYRSAEKLIIEVNDIDPKSIEMVKVLNKYRNISKNVKIIYKNEDFLSPFFNFEDRKYDLVIGNPPFLKLSRHNGLSEYSTIFNDKVTNNLSGFFLQKAIEISDYTALILPKYFLSNPNFSQTRNRVEKYSIDKVIDFGEKGFKGVLIETIALLVDTVKRPDTTISYSVTMDYYNKQKQSKLTSSEFPYWLIYRDNFFDKIASEMTFSVFKVFRDRQLTNKVLKSQGEVRVLKSRNISRDGSGVISIDGYNSYIDRCDLDKFSVSKYYKRDDVYLSPNMTYYPRVIKKPRNTIVNGSVAILENVTDLDITDKHLAFLSSPIFENFYRIARNYSTRSLNIDSNSVQFFGLYNGSMEKLSKQQCED